MSMITIDKSTCTRDGRCIASCPAALLARGADGFPKAIRKAQEICIRCGHCVTVCPTASLSHQDIPQDSCPPVDGNLQLTLPQGEQFLRSRRSIRAYEERFVPPESIQKLIELARYAPSGHNSQVIEWLVLSDREELRVLSGQIAAWMGTILTQAGDYARLLHLDRTLAGWKAGRDVFLRNAPVLVIAHAPKDNPLAPKAAVIALSYLELAAPLLGLGTCFAGYLTAAAASFLPLQEALKLPPGNQCLGALMLGYPRFSYHRLPSRLKPKITWRPDLNLRQESHD
jgi:nitroreductase/NAD-dependent dihydropyrimidine dehydrogenase PreA subunit